MQNESHIHGNHNIVIQGVSNSTITLSVDGELREIRNNLAALLEFLQQQQREAVQLGEKIYNINEIGQATFQTILQQAPFLPSKVLTNPPFYPKIFLGRADDLKAIHHQLFHENNLLLLVNGEGGIGKTTVAARYYFAYQDDYQHLAWVFAERSLLDALLTLALPLGVEFPQAMPNTERLPLLLRKMASLQRPCLLIIDNANLLEDLERYYPQLSACRNFHLLLTTRITRFEQAQTYAIKPLPPKRAVELFKQYYATAEDALLLEILAAVGYNTLVIELLAKNLRQLNDFGDESYTLTDLWVDLQERGLLQLTQTDTVQTRYHGKGALRSEAPEAIIAAMYDLSDLDEAVSALLSVFAVLPAENIPYATLHELLQPADTKAFKNQLRYLARRGWIEHNDQNHTFKCSPVIQEITRHKNQEQLPAHCETLLSSLKEKLKYEPGVGHLLNTSYEEAAIYARYAESMVNSLENVNNDIGLLCEYLGSYHNTVGNLDNALTWFEQYRACEQVLTEAHPDIETYKNNLAVSYSKLGATQSALGNLEQALGFFEEDARLTKELYEAFPTNVGFKNSLAISYEKLGETQSALGNLEQALGFFEEYNRLKKELYEAFPTNVGFKNGLAISYSKLGDTQSALGNLEQALRFFEESNRLVKELYEAFPTNVGFKNGLAISYSKLGDTQSALGNLEQALGFFEEYNRLEKELYDAFPTNVGFKNSLAISYAKLGEFYRDHRKDIPQARGYFQQAEALWAELVAASPAYVKFGRFLEIVRKILSELS